MSSSNETIILLPSITVPESSDGIKLPLAHHPTSLVCFGLEKKTEFAASHKAC